MVAKAKLLRTRRNGPAVGERPVRREALRASTLSARVQSQFDPNTPSQSTQGRTSLAGAQQPDVIEETFTNAAGNDQDVSLLPSTSSSGPETGTNQGQDGEGEDFVDMAAQRPDAIEEKWFYCMSCDRPHREYVIWPKQNGERKKVIPDKSRKKCAKHKKSRASPPKLVPAPTENGSHKPRPKHRSPKDKHRKHRPHAPESKRYKKATYDKESMGVCRCCTDDEDEDEVDRTPDDLTVTWCDLLGNLIGIGSYIFDVGVDIWLASMYCINGDYWYFGLTLSFVVLPALVMTFFSLMWYRQESKDYKEKIEQAKKNGACTKEELEQWEISPFRWATRLIFLVLQLAPVLRYIDSIVFCIWSRRAKFKYEQHHWYDRMLLEDADSTLLRLIECFLEAAPQLTLQLYIVQSDGLKPEWYMATGQVLGCVSSVVSLAWAIVAYHKALRLAHKKKRNISWTAFVLIFAWRLFTISARILAIALFASLVKHWVGVAIAAHWMIMLIWCCVQKSSFCEHSWQEPFFKMVMAFVYIFTYLNLIEGHTRLRYWIYYTLVYLENFGMAMFWFAMEGTNMGVFEQFALVMIWGVFFVGVLLQVIYYLCFHPNNYPHSPSRIKCCIPLTELLRNCCGEDGEGSDSSMLQHGSTPPHITHTHSHIRGEGDRTASWLKQDRRSRGLGPEFTTVYQDPITRASPERNSDYRPTSGDYKVITAPGVSPSSKQTTV